MDASLPFFLVPLAWVVKFPVSFVAEEGFDFRARFRGPAVCPSPLVESDVAYDRATLLRTERRGEVDIVRRRRAKVKGYKGPGWNSGNLPVYPSPPRSKPRFLMSCCAPT
jgi:hypothetical protein